MSNLLHVCVKHEIEYGASDFNWQIDGVRDLFKEAGCDICGELNEDGIGDWEIEEECFRKGVKAIQGMSEKKIASFFEKEYVGENLKEFKKRVVLTLQNFIDTGDHHNGYYHFSWF